jgi:hypothetical protein
MKAMPPNNQAAIPAWVRVLIISFIIGLLISGATAIPLVTEVDCLANLNRSLRSLGAAWGSTELEWRAVPEDWHWLRSQPVFCLTSE